MKKFICGLLVGFMLAIGVTTYAVPEIKSAVFSPDIKLVVNGKQVDSEVVSVVTSDNPGYMTNYVPARALAESLGATVTWDGKERVINVSTETAAVSSASAPAKTVSSEFKMPEKVIVNGYEFVLPSEVYYALQAKGYELMNDANNEYLQIVKDNKIVLKDIPTNARGGKFYIPYDFYETNILPLLQ